MIPRKTANIWIWLKKHNVIIILSLILVLAAFLRLYNLSNNVPALSQDEVVNGYDAYSLGMTHRDHHGNILPLTLASFGDSASVALTYLTIPFVIFGGLNDLMVRLPIALAGIASVLFMFLFLRALTKNRNIALLGAFVLATIPWHITLSRWAIPPSIVPCFLLLFLWLFTIAIRSKDHTKKRILYFIGAAISAALLTYSYPSAIVFAPVFIAGLSVIFLWKRWRDLLITLGSYAVIVMPLFYLIFFSPESSFRRFGSVRLGTTGGEFIQDVATRFLEYFSPKFLFGNTGENIMMQVPGHGNFYFVYLVLCAIFVISMILMIVRYRHKLKSLVLKIKPIHWKIVVATILWLILAPLPASITVDHEHLTRVIALLPVLTILISLITYYLIKKIKKYQMGFILLFAAIVLISTTQYFITYTTTYRAAVAETQFHYGVREGLKYIASIDKNNTYKNIVIDDAINQPYIYYLFYSAYNPRNIDRVSLNASLTAPGPYRVNSIGKYSFAQVKDSDIQNAKLVAEVTGFNRIWYRIYERDNQLFMKKIAPIWQD